MNKKVILIFIIVSVVFSSFIYFNYIKASNKKESQQLLLYFIQTAAFKKYENVSKLSKELKTFLVIKEEELYHVYIAITADKKNLEKLKAFYKENNYNICVKEKIVSDEKFIKQIKNYDYLLSETTDKEVIYSINKTILKKYEGVAK